MNVYTNTASFATTAAPTFHEKSTAKRGCDAVMMEDDASYDSRYERSHKRIKISSTEPITGLFSASSCHQPFFQAPIQFASPSDGSTCFTYGGEHSSQTKKRGRNA